MQKIMFEHRRFGLEQAVIARLKENTRRRVRFPKGIDDKDVESAVMGIDQKGWVYFTFTVSTHWGAETVDVYPKYQIGERVAIAQSYKNNDVLTYNAYNEDGTIRKGGAKLHREMLHSPGYRNKLFVRADLMPHVIEITDIKAERLQDIGDEDCLREGITKWLDCYIVTGIMEHHGQNNVCFDTPREAFARLIDLLNGRGTWERNEWQFAYTFKLIK